MACPFDNPYVEPVDTPNHNWDFSVTHATTHRTTYYSESWINREAALGREHLLALFRAGRISKKTYKRAVRLIGGTLGRPPVR